MEKKIVVMVCLALGLTACGGGLPEEPLQLDPIKQELKVEECLVQACDMDGCPQGMCATSTKPSPVCGIGYVFCCSQIRPGTLCI